MADAIKTIKENTKKLLKMGAADLMDKIHFYREVEKVEENAFKPDANGYSSGDTVSIKIPTTWLVQEDDFDITGRIQDAKERSVNLALDMSGTIPFDLDTRQLAHDIDVGAVYKRLIQPMINQMASNIESRMIKKATQYTGNVVGTAGSTIVDPDTVMSGGEKLDEYLAPDSDRIFLMDSSSMRNAVNANKNLFTFERGEYNKAIIGNALGFDWYKNQLIYRHTNGNDVTGLAVEASVVALTEGMTTLGVDGLTANTGTVTKGTAFTIAGHYAVHPLTKQSLAPLLKQYSHVGADVTANASGQVTLTLNEPIYGPASGSLQNVVALPVDEDAITVVGSASTTYKQSLMFQKHAFRAISVPLPMPTSAELAEQVNENGLNLALIKYFDGNTRKWVTRLDSLFGLVPVYPQHATRVTA